MAAAFSFFGLGAPFTVSPISFIPSHPSSHASDHVTWLIVWSHAYAGSSIKYILITAAVALRKMAPVYFARGQQHKFHNLIAAEEEEWEKKRREREEREGGGSGKGGNGGGEHNGEKDGEGTGTFEEYREKSKAAGVM